MLRIWLSLFLALVLSWASVPMAVARVSMAASITICTGDGAQVITLDANGDPVAHAACPDCCLAAPALLPAPCGTPTIAAAARDLASAPVPEGATPQITPRPAARGPPPLA